MSLGLSPAKGAAILALKEKYDTYWQVTRCRCLFPQTQTRPLKFPAYQTAPLSSSPLTVTCKPAAEEILDEALINLWRTSGGTIVVMDPRNGELLAIAASRRMDLNEFWNYSTIYDESSDFNPAISTPYEPGSVTKILTMAAALDSATVKPETTYLDTGSILSWRRSPSKTGTRNPGACKTWSAVCSTRSMCVWSPCFHKWVQAAFTITWMPLALVISQAWIWKGKQRAGSSPG
jgi:hypothetical protein